MSGPSSSSSSPTSRRSRRCALSGAGRRRAAASRTAIARRGIRCARWWLCDLRRLHHLPGLHQLRPVADRRGNRGAHRHTAVRDRGSSYRRRCQRASRGARLLRTLGRVPGVAADGGVGKGGDMINPWAAALFRTLRLAKPTSATEQSAFDKWARSDLGPRGGQARPAPRCGRASSRARSGSSLPGSGRRLRLHALLRGQRRGRGRPGGADGIGDHGDRAHAAGDQRTPRQPVQGRSGANRTGCNGAVAADPERGARHRERQGSGSVRCEALRSRPDG